MEVAAGDEADVAHAAVGHQRRDVLVERVEADVEVDRRDPVGGRCEAHQLTRLVDAGELAADGLQIVVSREQDEAWELETGSDCSVALGAVRPGSFVISVVGESLPRRALMPEMKSIAIRRTWTFSLNSTM